MSTSPDDRFKDLRKALQAVDADIDAARNKRQADESPETVRRLATRRTDIPWWMKQAG
ncbi:MAG: hypothetical protein MK074_01785 [Phycisphaerales bacterium]|nr:hypothetical protein [Phycisphaerales bacterium]